MLVSCDVMELEPSRRGGFMVERRFEIGQEVHVAQDHCIVCKKLELVQHPVRVMAIKPVTNLRPAEKPPGAHSPKLHVYF